MKPYVVEFVTQFFCCGMILYIGLFLYGKLIFGGVIIVISNCCWRRLVVVLD